MSFLRYSLAHLKSLQNAPTDRNVEARLSLRLQQDSALRTGSAYSVERILIAKLDEIVQLPVVQPAQNLHTELEEAKSAPARRPVPPTAARQLDGADAEWQYIRRSGLDCASSQPIPAPPELQTQQNEGFQRFFKAVVSPSHVRVTAGGRIVPNTRCSPASKHPKDTPFPETASMPKGFHQSFSSGHHFISGPAYHSYPPFFPAFPTALHGFPPPGPYPWPPWQVGLNVCAPYPHYALGHSLGHDPSHQGSERQTDASNMSKVDSFRYGLGPLDQARPGPHRDQWSTPPQAPLNPHVVPGLPKKIDQEVPAAPSVKSHGPAAAVCAKSPKLNSSFGDSRSEGAIAAQSGSHPSILSQAPISSIRPSHITKKQIDVLKSSLRYLEDQLQYNKHQIDEKEVCNQADLVREQIRHFKSNLTAQRSFEDSHYPKLSSKSEDSDSSNVLNGGGSGLVNTESSLTSDSGQGSSAKLGGQQLVTTSKGSLRSAGRPENDSITVSELLTSPMKSSRLPGHAAMAPPFRPRVGGDVEKPSWDASVSRFDARDIGMSSRNAASQSGSLRSRHLCSHELTGEELQARHAYWGTYSGSFPAGATAGDSSLCCNHTRSANVGIQESKLPASGAISSVTEVKPKRSYSSIRAGGQSRRREELTTQSESYVRHNTDSSVSTLASPRPESCILTTGGTRTYGLASYQSSVRDGSEGGTASASFSASLNDTQLKTPHATYGSVPLQIPTKVSNFNSAKKRKPRNEIWRTMLRKGKTNAAAVPGTVSSTTVQGVLPQYTGHAAAYLTPALANSTPSTSRAAVTRKTSHTSCSAVVNENHDPVSVTAQVITS